MICLLYLLKNLKGGIFTNSAPNSLTILHLKPNNFHNELSDNEKFAF